MVCIITCEGLPSANKDVMCDLIHGHFHANGLPCAFVKPGSNAYRQEPSFDFGMFYALLHTVKTLRAKRLGRRAMVLLKDWGGCITDPMMHDLYEECKANLLRAMNVTVDTEIVLNVKSNIHDSMAYVMNRTDAAFKNLSMGHLIAMYDALETRRAAKPIVVSITAPPFMSDNSFEQMVSVRTGLHLLDAHLKAIGIMNDKE